MIRDVSNAFLSDQRDVSTALLSNQRDVSTPLLSDQRTFRAHFCLIRGRFERTFVWSEDVSSARLSDQRTYRELKQIKYCRTSQPRFLSSSCSLFSNHSCNFSQESVGCKWNWKVLKGEKCGANIENFYNQIIFSIWWSKLSTPQPRFLSSSYIVLSNCFCIFSKKISWVKVKLESVEGRQRKRKYLKILLLNPFFYVMEQEIDQPNLGFWNLRLNNLSSN